MNATTNPNPSSGGHIPVLLETAIELLNPRRTKTYVDGTLGNGGHARAILARLGPHGRLIAFDCDPDALRRNAGLQKESAARVTLIHENFGKLAGVLKALKISAIDGLLLDLGVSSMQIDEANRGMSFQADGPLDLRMDPRLAQTAADIVNGAGEEQLADLFFTFGEERFGRRFARAIVEERQKNLFRTTGRLSSFIEKIHPRVSPIEKRKSIARIFQALRIAVNGELDQLKAVLEQSQTLLAPGARLVVLSYHSLEDRIVKHFLKGRKDLWEILTKKPLTASPDELLLNPRARSAKLRAAERR